MPILDDEQFEDDRFEAYLKRFIPLAPAALPIERPSYVARRSLMFTACAAAVTAILIVVIALYSRRGQTHATQAIDNSLGTEELVSAEPLTIRSANVWLTTAPSFKAAVDDMAFQPKATPLPKDKHSALAVLSKEKVKL